MADKDLGQFPLPVDSEHKSTKFFPYLPTLIHPYFTGFHLSWFCFFISFISTFAPAALIGIIRQDLDLTKSQNGVAGIAAVTGALASRIFMGGFVDAVGARFGMAGTMLLSSPFVFCMALVEGADAYIAMRFFIGSSLAAFVACQFWCGVLFNVKIVGTANAFSAGWGNMGGGATALIMPAVFDGLRRGMGDEFAAWRWAFFVPGALHIISGAACLFFGQDGPDGNYLDLQKAGAMKKRNGWPELKGAILNYRTWILTITYGYCFGVELTMDNNVVQYLQDHFNLPITTAGYVGSLFGMMNIFTRASGGMVSDAVARAGGMRARLWVLYITQTLGGLFCMLMGFINTDLTTTIVLKIGFAICCQMACGMSFGVAPFVSRRSYGLVSGFVGAGGNAGAALTQAIFFTNATYGFEVGFEKMGIMIMCVTVALFGIYFPMWGSMVLPARKGVTEEDYYLSEYTAEEVAQGMHNASLKFAYESRSQRGTWAANSVLDKNGMAINGATNGVNGGADKGMEMAINKA